jgi:hypothetical protein
MDSTLKIVLRQTIDIIFGSIALILLIIYMVDIKKNGMGEDVNYTGFLLLVVGYVVNNIVNKVRLIKEKLREDGQN